jgi:dienelactone hydrolase
MIRKCLVGIIIGLGVCLVFSLGRQKNPPADDLIVRARGFIEALSRGDFEAAAADFDETMIKVSPPPKLEEFWKGVPSHLGNFKRQTQARQEKLSPYDIVLVTCEFEKTTLDARVVFDKDGKIAGFQFVPSLPPAHYKNPAYADPSAFEEKEVTVGSGEWQLPGVLCLPKQKGPVPGLVLVHGSGPNDRDETIGPNKPFQDLAWGLATRGIAVLRYDKRTKVYGARFLDPEVGGSLTVREETIADALAGAELLKKTPGVDPGRVYILGHSLGGMLIPRIAVAGEHLGLAGFIIMAGLTRTIEDTYLAQMTYLLGLDGGLSEEDKNQLEEIRAQVERIKALRDGDASSGERLLNAPPEYWLDLRGYYPPDLARTVPKPFLVLQGARDYQVTLEDFENWKKALDSRTDVEFRLYPNLNHLFSEGRGLPTPSEYLQKSGNVSETVISDIAAFVKNKKI